MTDILTAKGSVMARSLQMCHSHTIRPVLTSPYTHHPTSFPTPFPRTISPHPFPTPFPRTIVSKRSPFVGRGAGPLEA